MIVNWKYYWDSLFKILDEESLRFDFSRSEQLGRELARRRIHEIINTFEHEGGCST
jgi:hypothetical protein